MRFSRRTLRAALAMAIGVLAACGDSGPTELDTPGVEALIPGAFHLVNINGRPLPYVMMDKPDERVEITGGELVIQSGSRFVQVLTFGETTPAGYVLRNSSVSGTYVMDGNRVVFRVTSGEEFAGNRLSGGYLDYTVQGNSGPLVFLLQRG